jgi:hypothetical protein
MGFISYTNFDIKCPLHYNVLHSHEHSVVLLRAAYEIETVFKNCSYLSFATTVSKLKIHDFSGETLKGFEVLLLSTSATTTQLLSSFANCVMTLYLLKVHLQTFLSIPLNKKCQILSCDTLVANERHMNKPLVGVI